VFQRRLDQAVPSSAENKQIRRRIMDTNQTESTIDRIISLEWQMFDKVQNISGRAACQDDKTTFDIMRRSQFEAWSDSLCESWLGDLLAAMEDGRNLMTEKYAYMMEYTAPDEFQSIKGRIPELSADKVLLIRKIVDRHLTAWEETVALYPGFIASGRGPSSSFDEKGSVSIETYLSGELATYSMNTLILYDAYLDELAGLGKNIAEMTYQLQGEKYGFETVADFDSVLKPNL